MFTRNWVYLLQKYFWSSVYLKDVYKTLKGIGKIRFLSELTILLNLQISKFYGSLRDEKNFNYQSFNTTPYLERLTLVYHLQLLKNNVTF